MPRAAGARICGTCGLDLWAEFDRTSEGSDAAALELTAPIAPEASGIQTTAIDLGTPPTPPLAALAARLWGPNSGDGRQRSAVERGARFAVVFGVVMMVVTQIPALGQQPSQASDVAYSALINLAIWSGAAFLAASLCFALNASTPWWILVPVSVVTGFAGTALIATLLSGGGTPSVVEPPLPTATQSRLRPPESFAAQPEVRTPFPTPAPRPPVGVLGRLELRTDAVSTGDNTCTGSGDYADIVQGLGLIMRDEAGVILDTAYLTTGGWDQEHPTRCTFAFVFGSLPDARTYSIQVASHGTVTYTWGELYDLQFEPFRLVLGGRWGLPQPQPPPED